MTDEAPRKASDVLLSLEDKINTVTKIISAYDLKLTIVLDRVNKIYAFIEMLQKEREADVLGVSVQAVERNPTPKLFIPETIGNSPVAIENTSSDLPEHPGPVDRGRISRISREQLDNVNVDPDKKVPVTQRITDQVGKDIFNAEVSILNDNKELVMKTKTNAVGKWQAYLKPSHYIVNIVKTDTATKRKIESSQEFLVTDSKNVMTLPTAIIKR